MLIDTHCHLDAGEFDGDRDQQVRAAAAAGIRAIVIPAVAVKNFTHVRDLARRHAGCVYALGIHPMYVDRAGDDDLERLRQAVAHAVNDARFVGIGEIGLDYFVPGLDRERQQRFFEAQLALARDFELPVILHVRRSQDMILKGLRRLRPRSGIAHAFNGSHQQARMFLDLGFAMGFGGAMTFARALQIRRLAAELPPEAHVLETDAPDIPPQWINRQRNAPAELAGIARVLAELRQQPLEEIARQTADNACRVLPRLAAGLAVGSGASADVGQPGAAD